jgi:hypothetical protein
VYRKSSNSQAIPAAKSESWHVYTTPRGEIKKINLDALRRGLASGPAWSGDDRPAEPEKPQVLAAVPKSQAS